MILLKGATVCIPCLAGKTSNPQHTKCDACPPGYYSGSPGMECLKCPIGSYQPNNGSKSCVDCPPGKLD